MYIGFSLATVYLLAEAGRAEHTQAIIFFTITPLVGIVVLSALAAEEEK